MPSPDVNPGRVPPEGTQTSRRSTKRKEGYTVIPTHMPGVSLRAEPGAEVDILRKTTDELATLAREYSLRKFQLDQLNFQQQGLSERIKGLAASHEGLRGIQSEEDNFILNVVPRDSVTWNQPLLRESLGILYPAVVHEDLSVFISVPVGYQTDRGPMQEALLRQVLSEAMVSLGLEEADLQKIMEMRIFVRVDAETLNKMIEKGQVSLLEGTKETERNWAITVAPLKKSPES